jgi:hypothetical protein
MAATVTIPLEEYTALLNHKKAHEENTLMYMTYYSGTLTTYLFPKGSEHARQVMSERDEYYKRLMNAISLIREYDSLPWYRRIFTKPQQQ